MVVFFVQLHFTTRVRYGFLSVQLNYTIRRVLFYAIFNIKEAIRLNRIYKVIFNRAKGQHQVVSELAKNGGKTSGGNN